MGLHERLADAGATDPAIEFIPGGAELSIESIAAAEPDLIVGWDSYANDPAYTQMQEIAPFVGVPIAGWDEKSHLDSWFLRDFFRIWGSRGEWWTYHWWGTSAGWFERT